MTTETSTISPTAASAKPAVNTAHATLVEAEARRPASRPTTGTVTEIAANSVWAADPRGATT